MKRTLRLSLMLALVLGAVAILTPLGLAAPLQQDSTTPIVIIDRPPSNAEYDEGATVTVESTSAAAVGIVQVDLYVDGKLADSDLTPNNQPQFQFKVLQTWTAQGAGKHTLTVRATDSENQTGEASVIIIVRGRTPTPTATPTTTPVAPTPTSSPEQCTLNARFISDVTIPDYTLITPGATFTKIWALQNNGMCAWGVGYNAVFVSGERMAGASPSPLPSAQPGQTINIAINFVAPTVPGLHKSVWQLQTPQGVNFGVPFYVLIQVPGAPTPTPVPPTPTPQGCQGAPQITSFTTNKSALNQGNHAVLSWGPVYNADYVALESPQGSGGIATPGQQQVNPTATTTYTLAAYCNGYRVQRQVTIFVQSKPTPTPQPNRIHSVEAKRQDNTITITVNYYWNGDASPANMTGVGLQNGTPKTNTDSRAIISGFVKFVILTVQGGNKINGVSVCMVGHGGIDLACSNAPVK
ncbi:MAG: hypothetical protein HY741_15640 [Chloroflexi bacterium]|nr:hypothetical protein [Chloroflexota bacterium]